MSKTELKSSPRRLGLKQPAEDLSGKLRRMIVSVFMAKKSANTAKSDYDKQRKELLGFMKNNKISKEVVEGAEINGMQVSLQAELETPVSEKADIEKLYKLIGHEAFMKIAKVGKGDVEAVAGKAVWEQVKSVSEGEENVTVDNLKV